MKVYCPACQLYYQRPLTDRRRPTVRGRLTHIECEAQPVMGKQPTGNHGQASRQQTKIEQIARES